LWFVAVAVAVRSCWQRIDGALVNKWRNVQRPPCGRCVKVQLHNTSSGKVHWIGLELWLLMVVAMLWLCGSGLDWLRALAISHASRHQPNVHASLKAPRNPTPNATQPRGWRIRRLMAFGDGDDGRDASHDFAVGCSGLRLDDWLFVG